MAKTRPQTGNSLLSQEQREEFAKFRAKHKSIDKMIRHRWLSVHEAVLLWRDGYICGAMHGMEVSAKMWRLRK